MKRVPSVERQMQYFVSGWSTFSIALTIWLTLAFRSGRSNWSLIVFFCWSKKETAYDNGTVVEKWQCSVLIISINKMVKEV